MARSPNHPHSRSPGRPRAVDELQILFRNPGAVQKRVAAVLLIEILARERLVVLRDSCELQFDHVADGGKEARFQTFSSTGLIDRTASVLSWV